MNSFKFSPLAFDQVSVVRPSRKFDSLHGRKVACVAFPKSVDGDDAATGEVGGGGVVAGRGGGNVVGRGGGADSERERGSVLGGRARVFQFREREINARKAGNAEKEAG
ncbi:hypothetical protein Droror1_Dr00028317 [Drosera rotundifolia]